MEIQLMSNNEIPPGIKSVYAVLQYSCNSADGELHLSSAFTDKQSAVRRLCYSRFGGAVTVYRWDFSIRTYIDIAKAECDYVCFVPRRH